MQFEKVKLDPVVDGVSQSSCENGMSNFIQDFVRVSQSWYEQFLFNIL